MKVYLGPDSCEIYKFWSEWVKSDHPAATIRLDGRPPVKYFNSTAQNRYRFGLAHGYTACQISWEDRDEFLEDIYQINISLENRQGKPMKENYMQYPSRMSSSKFCNHHHATFIACFHHNTLIAYISTNFCGQLAAASQILGHGDHLKNGCMLVLWAEFIRICQERKMDTIVYSRWGDGTQGLRYWKHSVGMKPEVLRENVNGVTS